MTDEIQTEAAEDGEAQITLSRDQIRSMERDAKEARTLKKEIAFMKAGIDTSKGVGKLAFSSYDGDTTPEAITAFAEEYGITTTTTEAQSATSEQPGLRYDASEAEQTGVRRLTATGGAPDDGSEDPRSAALKMGREVRQTRTQDDAIAAAVSVLATAAKNGDKRAIIREVNQR